MDKKDKEMDKENKKRKPNWTEMYILLDEYGKRKAILKSKLNPCCQKKPKHKQWEEITKKINARNLGVKRTVSRGNKKL